MIGARPVFSADDEGRFAHLLIDQNAIPDVTVVPRLTGPDKIFQGRVDIRGAVPANAIEHTMTTTEQDSTTDKIRAAIEDENSPLRAQQEALANLDF